MIEEYLTKKLMVDHPPSRKHLLSTCPHIVPSIVSVSHVTRVTLRDMMCPRDSVTTFCLTWLHIWGLYSYKPPRQNISLAISSVLAITSAHNTCRTCLSLDSLCRNVCRHLISQHRTVTVSVSLDTCWGKPGVGGCYAMLSRLFPPQPLSAFWALSLASLLSPLVYSVITVNVSSLPGC